MKPLLRGVLLVAVFASVNAARADWLVQVAALSDSLFLRQMSAAIRRAGFPVTTEPVARPEAPALTRLLVGPYETKAEAQAAAVKLTVLGWPGYLRQRAQVRPTSARPTPARPTPARPTPATPATPVRATAAPAPTPTRVTPKPVSLEPVPLAPPAAATPTPSAHARIARTGS
jgi:hypothetical protein